MGSRDVVFASEFRMRARSPNHTIQRMGASRLAQSQSGSPRRLAPTADGGRSARVNTSGSFGVFHEVSRHKPVQSRMRYSVQSVTPQHTFAPSLTLGGAKN